jgi:transcriptional regulator with XRE-family HTH domain
MRSRIENDKSDPALSSLVKIVKALGVDVGELFTVSQVIKDVNSLDKSVIEKVSLIEQLDKKEAEGFADQYHGNGS